MTGPDVPLAAGFEQPSREAWLKLVEKVLKGADFEKRLVSRTADGLAVEPLYTRQDTGQDATPAPLPAGRTGARAWDIRQRHAEPDAVLANKAILEDLEGGVTSLLLQIKAPGQTGISYRAKPLSTALKGVFLNACTIALDARENTMDAAGSLIEIWREGSIGENVRRGAFNFDPLGVLAETGTLYHPAGRSCEIAAELANSCRSMPHVSALLADGRPYHEAGASEAQELAAMLATLVAYLRACETAGLRPRFALAKIALGLAADADLFLTIAKLRAARLLVARVADACGAGTAAESMHLTATTSERMMARRDPWVNMLRTTAACAGAAFGGADAITVLPFTWALGQPDAFARRIARNTHLVLQEESALGRVADPAAGSWFVEKLTQDLAQKAWSLFQEIEAKGGMARALETEFIQAQIGKVAEARARSITTGRLELTGVSAFPMLADDGVKAEPHPVPDPVVKGATSVAPLTPRRLAEPFERLRDASDAHLARTGRRPQVFVATLGELSEFNTRATWTTNFLAAGGIEAIVGEGAHNSADAGKAFAESGAPIACLCSSDKIYAELGEATAGVLKAAGARQVLLAGRPREQEAALKAAGVDGFVHAGCDAVQTLTGLHRALNVGE
ncbi:MAG: methylmalonyl-CoA mutase [Hyphomicrobiaceae bacterium]|nr:MAG: methylmalonyl-CoA mutase [Hyphomicrobiaceae bacterium]